jgi:hypothetical protein
MHPVLELPAWRFSESHLPLVSRLTRHIGCRKAPKAILHRGSPKGTSHTPEEPSADKAMEYCGSLHRSLQYGDRDGC